MKWEYVIFALAATPEVGNRYAAALANDSGDATAFSKPPTVRRLDDANVTGIFVSTPARATGLAAVQEFNSDGPYPILNAAGIDDAQIAADKASFVCVAGHHTTMEMTEAAWLASLGYEIIPQES